MAVMCGYCLLLCKFFAENSASLQRELPMLHGPCNAPTSPLAFSTVPRILHARSACVADDIGFGMEPAGNLKSINFGDGGSTLGDLGNLLDGN